jgi:hypothetical protein
MPRIDFKCPKCGEDLLTEIQPALTSYEVNWIEEPDEYGCTSLDYGELLGTSNLDHDPSYECAVCFHQIATNAVDLYAWLEEHGMLGKEETNG